MVDNPLNIRHKEFKDRGPQQMQIFCSHHYNAHFQWYAEFPNDPNSCYFLGNPLRSKVGLHHVRRIQTFLSREIGITVAEFQTYINPDISKEGAINPYYDSELKKMYQDEFEARCPRTNRCVRPGHLVLFRNGFPYDYNEDPTPLPKIVVEQIQESYRLTRSDATILLDASIRLRGAQQRIPHRLWRLERDIAFLEMTSPINDQILNSKRRKCEGLRRYALAIDIWLSRCEYNKVHPTEEETKWLLDNIPTPKDFLQPDLRPRASGASGG